MQVMKSTIYERFSGLYLKKYHLFLNFETVETDSSLAFSGIKRPLFALQNAPHKWWLIQKPHHGVQL
jgi:hypothetical protein